jgi:hypothetical protein
MFAHVAAGATWTRVVHDAPWAARDRHTTVIDAVGNFYLIGGVGGACLGPCETLYQDVWLSTDKGASCTRGVLESGLCC